MALGGGGEETGGTYLHNKVTHDTTIIFKHTRAIGIEYPRHTYLHPILAIVLKTESLSHALSFIIAACGKGASVCV